MRFYVPSGTLSDLIAANQKKQLLVIISAIMKIILVIAIYIFYIWRNHEYLIYLQPIIIIVLWTGLLEG